MIFDDIKHLEINKIISKNKLLEKQNEMIAGELLKKTQEYEWLLEITNFSLHNKKIPNSI